MWGVGTKRWMLCGTGVRMRWEGVKGALWAGLCERGGRPLGWEGHGDGGGRWSVGG